MARKHRAEGVVDALQGRGNVDAALLSSFHSGLCAVREDILRLMDKYRKTI